MAWIWARAPRRIVSSVGHGENGKAVACSSHCDSCAGRDAIATPFLVLAFSGVVVTPLTVPSDIIAPSFALSAGSAGGVGCFSGDCGGCSWANAAVEGRWAREVGGTVNLLILLAYMSSSSYGTSRLPSGNTVAGVLSSSARVLAS